MIQANAMIDYAMRRWSFSFLAVALVAGAPSARADAQLDQIDGAWQQIESNAGACPKCRISIDQDGSSLIVTANNGWSASVTTGQNTGLPNASGVGRWGTNLTGAWVGKRFKIDFVLKDQRLTMSMLVDMENGSTRTIHAVFGRPWFGA
jgi:hypothetical protein